MALISVELHMGLAFYIVMSIKGTEIKFLSQQRGCGVCVRTCSSPPGSTEPFGPTGWGGGSTKVSLAGVLLLLPPNHAKNTVKTATGKYKAAALLWLEALVWQGWV